MTEPTGSEPQPPILEGRLGAWMDKWEELGLLRLAVATVIIFAAALGAGFTNYFWLWPVGLVCAAFVSITEIVVMALLFSIGLPFLIFYEVVLRRIITGARRNTPGRKLGASGL